DSEERAGVGRCRVPSLASDERGEVVCSGWGGLSAAGRGRRVTVMPDHRPAPRGMSSKFPDKGQVPCRGCTNATSGARGGTQCHLRPRWKSFHLGSQRWNRVPRQRHEAKVPRRGKCYFLGVFLRERCCFEGSSVATTSTS